MYLTTTHVFRKKVMTNTNLCSIFLNKIDVFTRQNMNFTICSGLLQYFYWQFTLFLLAVWSGGSLNFSHCFLSRLPLVVRDKLQTLKSLEKRTCNDKYERRQQKYYISVFPTIFQNVKSDIRDIFAIILK